MIRAKNDFAHGNASRSAEIRDLECSLSSLALREAEGAKIRSRVKWFEEGEKPTRYFLRRENQRAAKNSFDSLINSQGEETSSQTDMESILIDFYKNLFSKDNLDLHVQQSLIDDLEFTLSDSERVSCEGDLTKDELFMALGGLQTGKSPGSDGLPTEFYKAFWQDLGDVLVLVLNERFHTGILTDSQREGLLRLLYKKDDRRLVKNWRPISLLNTDYKLASKVITERLKRVMQSIVHKDQTCGVVDRSIFSNLQLIRDMLDMIDKTNETGILVTLDQEKAFDRVDHDFLMRVLLKFGFGPSFRRWVSLFYKNVFSRIICNGSLSARVFLRRGCETGLSSLPPSIRSGLGSQIKFVNVRTLKVSGSLETAAFNSKSRSMLMTPRYLSKLNDLSVDFCKLLNCTNAVQELNLTPPNPRPCGLGDGGVMGLLLLV